MKRRGGVGHDLSHIRPSGSPVKNSAITSTGIVPFMERYSNSTREVAQDGRRGALMLSVSIKHPDSEKFIDAKLVQGKITGANISVKIDDEFMNAAIQGTTYQQTHPIYSVEPKYVKEIDAQKLWKKIIFNAWKSAEPGILFWDTVMRESIPDCYADLGFKTVSTNPCGEIPLCPNDSCRLLAINLFGYVIHPFTPDAYFDFDAFKKDVYIAMRYMDDIIDLEIEKINAILAKIQSDPEDEIIKLYEINLWNKIMEMTLMGRRTGLGVTAEGDMLAALGLCYGTEAATKFSEKVHQTLKLNAYRSSVDMAKERGAFSIYDAKREANNPFILRIKQEDPKLWADMIKFGRRNIALLTIAPTGTVSIMTQTTSGIEPCFLPVYMRRRKINPQEKDIRIDFVDDEGIAWMEYPVFHHKFETWLEVNGYDVKIVKSMTKEQVDEVVKKSPYYKATSNDVDWVMKVEMQGRLQKHVDHSISVTVNLPETVDEETVSKVYETGWKSGCKGITVYRDGSRSGVLVGMDEKKNEFHENHAPKLPKRLKAEIHRFQNALEKWVAVVGLKDGRPYEIFTGKNENGLTYLPNNVKDCEVVKQIFEVEEPDEFGKMIKVRKKRYDIEYIDSNGEKQVHTGLNHAFNPEFWNYSKFISAVLRHGMPIVYTYELIDSLNFKEDYINTWKNGVARVIKRYIKDGEKGKGKCLNCGSDNLIFQEGCLICKACGSSKCG
jgi:ribonucleoside-diphosphate reductase alpha chain